MGSAYRFLKLHVFMVTMRAGTLICQREVYKSTTRLVTVSRAVFVCLSFRGRLCTQQSASVGFVHSMTIYTSVPTRGERI